MDRSSPKAQNHVMGHPWKIYSVLACSQVVSVAQPFSKPPIFTAFLRTETLGLVVYVCVFV